MNLQELRQKYPQYNHMTDQQLAGALHKKYYAQMPYEQFTAKIGLAAPGKQSGANRITFDVAGARKAGYSATEIAGHLAGLTSFDAAAAHKAGYTDEEIITHLTGSPALAKTHDWADAVLSPKSPAGAGPKAPTRAEHDYAAAVFDPAYDGQHVARSLGMHETPTGRATVLDGAIPEPIEGSGAGFAANLKGSIPEDEQTRIAVMAKERFPKDPDAVRRFGRINGRIAFVNERGQYEYADSGFGSRAGAVLSALPETVGSVAGSLATLNPFSGSVIGGVGGRGVKRILSALLFDEPQTTGGNVLSMGEEAVAGTFGGILGKTGSLAYNRAAVRNADRFDMPQARALRERIKQSTGIELDLAQAGNLPQLRNLKKWAAKYPSEAQEIIETMDREQAGQVATAIETKVLGALSKETDLAVLAASGVNAAKAAISMVKMKREAAVRPLYQAAYKDSLEPMVVKGLKSDPLLKTSLERVKRDPAFKRELEGVGDQTLQTWDLVKRNLDDQIESAKRAGDNNRARIITKAKDDLTTTLDSFSESYKAARAEYQRLSSSLVEPLESGVVGVLSKVGGPRAAQLVAGVMDDLLANPTATSAAKLILQKQGPQAWRDLVKSSLARSFDRAAKETQSGDVVNLAGKFRQAVIGTPQRKAAMEKALGGEGVPAFNDVMDALHLIAKEARNRGGSDTAFNQEITNLQRGGMFTSLTRFVTAPAKTIRESLDEKVLQNNSVAIAQALADPMKLGRLKELRKMRPSTERAVAILSVVGLGQSTGAAGRALTATDVDRAAPIAGEADR